MAGWGAMMGLGQGLQSFGGMLLDHNKTKMREKLEIEREERQVQRELDKEQRALDRELIKPTEWRPTQDDSGNTYLQAFNSHGKPIQGERRDMSKYEAEEFARKQRMGELEVEGKEQTVANQGLEGQLKGFEVRDYDADRALKRRREEASIESSLASAQASRSRAMNAGSRGSSDDEASTQAQAAKLLTKEYKDLISSYLGTAEKPGPLTTAEVEEIAMEAVRAAALQRKDATVMFRDELARRAARNKDPEGINFR